MTGPSDNGDPGFHERLRQRMVDEQLAQRGIHDPCVLEVMGRIPREVFVPAAYAASAYEDNALPIEEEQTISQPYMVGRMTELLAVTPDSRVLEVGTGSGYQTAILAALAQHVYSIEQSAKLTSIAKERLERLQVQNVTLRCGDGSLGWPEEAPFDGIIVTAGAPVVPEPLREQLALDGRLVVPVGYLHDQTLVLVQRREDGFSEQPVLKCRFVKLVGAAGWKD